jgi:hypothetical protein
MGLNSSGPTSTAVVEDRARGSDQATSEIGPVDNIIVTLPQQARISKIKAHIAKGEQTAKKSQDHFISAGQELAALKKEHVGTWDEWAALLKAKIGISTGRASELMQIADGRKTVAKLRDADAQKHKRLRDQRRSSGHPEEDADTPEDPEVERDKAEVRRLYKRVLNAEAEAERGRKQSEPARKGWSRERYSRHRAKKRGVGVGTVTYSQREEQRAEADQVAAILLERLGHDTLVLVNDALQVMAADRLSDAIDRQIEVIAPYTPTFTVEDFLTKYGRSPKAVSS